MTGSTYRVLSSPREESEFLLLDTETADPVYVINTGYEDELEQTVTAIEPGNMIRATFDWSDERPRFSSVEIVTETSFAFAPDATNIFEAAIECWHETEAAGEAMNSHVTRNTDGDVNGVFYVFAQQAGERDLFSEFRNGIKPIDPLLDSIDGSDPPYQVFGIEPREEPFVLIYIVLEPNGMLAQTVRETYEFE
jgi:hypothetical protein